MNINILTLFPEMFKSVFSASIVKRAIDKNIVKINTYNLRNWAKDKHKTVDDSPYGGGAGMVLKVDVIDHAIASLKLKMKNEKLKIILLTPQGKTYNQKKVEQLSKCKNVLLICGHYEGFDERVRKLIDEEISIGDYVLTGGEIPAMVLIDSITRLIPGVLGKNESNQEESFSMEALIKNSKHEILNPKQIQNSKHVSKLEIRNLKFPPERWLEYPHYTRPESYKPISKKYKSSLKAPKVLLSGNHKEIKKWRVKQMLSRSK